MKLIKVIYQVLTAGTALVVLAAFLMTALPKLAGIQLFAVQTGSMEPEYPVGSVVYAVPAAFEEIDEGDVISYVLNEQLTVVTHRVVSQDTEQKTFVTKGDANKTSDGAPVRYENVIGRVDFSVPKIGYPLMWLQNTGNRIIAVTAAAVLGLALLLMQYILKEEKGVKAQSVKKNLTFLLLTVVLTVSAAGIVLAGLQKRTEYRINEFDTGSTEIEITEPGTDPDAAEWGTGMKQVQLKNTGDTPAVARAMILPLFRDAESKELTVGELGELRAPEEKQLILGDFRLYFYEAFTAGESENWKYREADGYFYYKKILYPNDETEKLLDGIELRDESLTDEYQGIRIEVEVLADSIQADGNAPAEWGLTVAEGELSFDW